MRYCYFYAGCFLIFLALTGNRLWAQSSQNSAAESFEDPVADWLDPDTALLVTLTDVSETASRLQTLSFMSDPKVAKAIELLSDQRFPVLTIDDIEAAKDKLFVLESLLDSVKRVNFVVHRYDPGRLEWSLFIHASPEVQEELEGVLVGFDQLLKEKAKITRGSQFDARPQFNLSRAKPLAEGQKAQLQTEPLGDKTKTDTDLEDKGETPNEASETKDLGRAELKTVGDWMVLSNSNGFLSLLETRIDNDEYRSLAKSRKYKGILNTTSNTRDEPGSVFIYGMPQKMAQLTPYLSEPDYKQLKIHEMPAFGIALAILDADERAPNKPIVVGECMVKFTSPPVGRAKTTLLLQPVEIPALAQRPIELHAAARDELAINNEIVKNYDELYGEGAAYRYWDSHFSGSLIDLHEDVLPRRKAIIDYRFIDENHSIDQPGIITIEMANEPNALRRYARAVAEKAGQQADLTETIENDVLWWKRKSFRQSSGATAIRRWQLLRVDLFNIMHDAYAVNDRFWVQGDLPVIERQVDLLVNNHGIDHSEPIRQLIDDLRMRLKTDGPPVKVIFYRPEAWHENLKNLENKHLSEMQLDFQPAPVEGDKSAMRFSVSYLNLRKKKARDEFGVPFEIVAQDDLTMAIELMLRRAVAESFPRQLILYTKTDSHLRILLGAYPDEVDEANQKGPRANEAP